MDNISEVGRPENINIDNPLNGKTYRAMVHFYNGSQTTSPMVNIYCGGALKGTYGAAPDTVSLTQSGGFGGGDMWRVVDVKPAVNGQGVTTDCELTPLHPPGESEGYFVTTDDRSF